MRWTSQLGRSGRSDAPRSSLPLQRPSRTAHARRAVAARARAGQGGFTLMEIIVSVMLVSMVVLGIAAGFLGLVRTNRMTQEQQAVDHAVTNYSESLKSAEYLPCSPGPDPDYDASTGLWVSDRGVTVWVDDVDYWDESAGAFVDTCASDSGAQRLTVRAEWRDRERQGQIVKRSR